MAIVKKKNNFFFPTHKSIEIATRTTIGWRTGAVAATFWATCIIASAMTQIGKTNTVASFVIVLEGCTTGSKPEKVFILSEKFPSFEAMKVKFALPMFSCWFKDDPKSKLSRTVVLYFSSPEIIWWNYASFPLHLETIGYQCHHRSTTKIKEKDTVTH